MSDYAASQALPECSVHRGSLNIVRMTNLPKLMCRFNINLIKIQTRFFVDTAKIILIFIWKTKGIEELKQKEERGRNQSTHF